MQSWEQFFDGHAPHYMENPFTANTRAEVEFLEDLCELRPGSNILDLGCGTGRHAVLLAQRGMAVTGVDLSQGMLDEATKAASSAEVTLASEVPAAGQLRLIKQDVTQWRPDIEYDAVFCLCEGGFGLIGASEDPVAHDLAILRNSFLSLRKGGMFVLTAMNGYATIRQMTDELVMAGRFDPATMFSIYEDEWDLPEGRQAIQIRERLFIPPELVAMMRHVGFRVEAVWGGTAGDWGRRPVKLDEVEAMYVGRRE